MKNGTQLKAALIGCGRMGSQYALALQETEKVVLHGVYDPFLKKEDMGRFMCKVYANEEDLFSDPLTNFVIIATPNHLHKDFTIRATQNKKNVLVEKPIALNLQDSKEMIESAELNGVRLVLSSVERFNPVYRKIKELLSLSSLGEIISISAKRKTKSTNRPNWYWDIEKSGGVIVDLAIHDIDLLLWLVDDQVETVYAQSYNPNHSTAIDTAMLLLRFRGGVIANIDVSWRLDPSFPSWGDIHMEIMGNQGMIVSDFGLFQPLFFAGKSKITSFIHPQEDSKWTNIDFTRQNLIKSMLESFSDSIANEKAFEVNAMDGLKALEVALSAMRSLDLNRPNVCNL